MYTRRLNLEYLLMMTPVSLMHQILLVGRLHLRLRGHPEHRRVQPELLQEKRWKKLMIPMEQQGDLRKIQLQRQKIQQSWGMSLHQHRRYPRR